MTEANRRYTIDLDDYRTTYLAMDGLEHDAFQLPWTVVEALLGHPHTGDGDEDEELISVLFRSGGPGWLHLCEGWVDGRGWGVYSREPRGKEV